MTAPADDVAAVRPARPMTPERWRAVDAVLQAALACEPGARDAFVAEACADDAALRAEVSSLLAMHSDAPPDELREPAATLLGAPPVNGRLVSALADRYANDREIELAAAAPIAVPSPAAVPTATPGGGESRPARPGRTVSAGRALYAAAATLLVGFIAGILVDRWYLPGRSAADERAVAPPADVADVAPSTDLPLAIVDRSGRQLRDIAGVNPWTPRFSRDGRRLAYGAFGPGRQTSDLWVTDLDAGTTRRLTDDDRDSNDPQWSRDGQTIVYSANAADGKDVMVRQLNEAAGHVLAARPSTQFPSDWQRDGSALLVTEESRTGGGYDVIVQPADGSEPHPYAATRANETSARFSPDGRWVAYTSDESGRARVYLDSYPRPGKRVAISSGDGAHPAWRGDGRELYYWRSGALIAVQLAAAKGGAPPASIRETVLFRAPYPEGISTMYDVSPDGQRFVIVRQH